MNSGPPPVSSLVGPAASILTVDTFAVAGVGLLYTDLMGRCVAVNAAFCKIAGYREDDIVGQSVATLAPSSFVAEAERLHALLARGTVDKWTGETRIRKSDGTTLAAMCEARLVTDANGDRFILSAFTDITEQSRARAKLKKRMAEWATLLKHAPVGLVITRNQLVVHHNPRFAALFGLDSNAVNGKPVPFAYVDPTQARRTDEEASRRLAAGQPYETEVEFLRRDGGRFWAHLHVYGAAGGTGAPVRAWIVEDRSAYRTVETQLRRVLLEQQAILDNSVLGICLVQDRTIRRCNARMHEMFGYGPAEMVGELTRIMYTSDDAWAENGINAYAALGRGESFQRECVYRRRDGSELWVRESGHALDPAKPHGGSVWLFEDITARRETEALLHKHQHELEALVDERTAELRETNARLEAEIAERARVEERMRHMAQHDELTGLPNRALLGERLQQTIAAQPAGTTFAVLFADLDRFKTVNDTLGHGTGDALLTTVARRLQFSLRKGDTVARVGGDEFVVVLPNADASAAREAAERLLSLVAEPIAVDEMSLHITPSVGICMYPQDADSPDLLMRHADAAMYQAKSSGRNTFAFYNARSIADSHRAFHMENDLRRAFLEQQFEVHFQPVCRLSDRMIVGLEALIRWRHPEQGLVGAGAFVGVAEESGLIQKLGDWVFGQTCRIVATWRAAGIDVPKVAINLSVQQLWRPGLVERVTERLHHHGLTGGMIEFEITEQTVMTPTAETLDILRSLRAAGIALSIDDFGTGYSSLNYLRTLPVTKLKIDRSFVEDVHENPDDNPIIRAILAMASALDLTVVAEGIENGAQADRLRDYGCEMGQGYFLSQPLRAAEIPALLRARSASKVH
jgi:diguanylate cyclase (GGDEF)-like protein/PAS domain S-box-containing protein